MESERARSALGRSAPRQTVKELDRLSLDQTARSRMPRMRCLSSRTTRCVLALRCSCLRRGMDSPDRRADSVLVCSQFGSNQREVAKQKEDLRVLLEHFDEQQMDRYEAYRRSGLTKSSVRKVRGETAR